MPLLAAAAVSLCAVRRTFAVVPFPATVGFQSPIFAGLARNVGASPHLEVQDYSN